MGKKSKDDLEKENIQLTSTLQNLDCRYKEVHQVVQRLDVQYENSKGSLAQLRYQALKRMIRESTTDETLHKAKQLHDSSGPSDKVTGMKGLLKTCQQFAEGSSDTKVPERYQKDLKSKTKQEIERDNSEKEEKIAKYKTQFLRIYNRLDKLKRDFDGSKGQNFIHRYNNMKDMIKTVTHDKIL